MQANLTAWPQRGLFTGAKRAGGRIALGAAVLFCTLGGVHAADIPWRSDQIFEHASHDEDVRSVLRSLLKQNGLEVVFRPGVQGTVTFEFSRMPLRGAFNKLVEENALTYEYADDTRTVTISVKGQSTTEFIPLKFIDEAKIEGVRRRFRLGAEVIFDPSTKTVMLKGEPDQVRALRDLLQKLETSEAEMFRLQTDALGKQATADHSAAAAEETRARARLLQEQAESQRRARIDVEEVTVKVVPLRFASVGPVRVKFQGEDVSIPGLIDTLNNLLGVNAAKSTAQNDQQSVARILAATAQANGPDVPEPSGQQNRGTRVDLQPPVPTVRVDATAFHGAISADTRTNSVIVRGTPREIQQVQDLVAKLDRPMEQVEIETMIVATSANFLDNLGVQLASEGVSFNAQRREMGGAFGSLTTSGAAAAAGSAIGTGNLTNLTADGSLVSPLSLLPLGQGAAASFLFRGARSSLAAYITARSQEQKAHLLSSPRVVTLDNIGAKITADGTLFVPTPAGANAAGGFLQIPAGLTLKITPSVLRRDDVGEDNMLRLVIEAENTSASFQGGSAARQGNQIQTQVIIPDGSTFVMGGLTSDTRREDMDKVPLLSEIPLLGELFKLRGAEQSQSETVFFITPRIIPRADLYTRDVAEKRYLQTQRAAIERTANDVRTRSRLLGISTKTMVEDE